MNAVPLSSPPADPDRRAAIRGMVLDTIDAAPAERRRRVVRLVSIATAAVVIVGGAGVVFATLQPSASPDGNAGAPPATSEPAVPLSPSATPAPTTSLPPGVDPAGTATPLPTPTSTANDPANASTWLITTDGLGPVALGESYADADAAFAKSGLTNPNLCSNGANPTYTLKDGITVQLASGFTSSIEFITILGDPNDTGYSPHTGGPKTPHGIGIGTTESVLKATYPNLVASGAGYWDGTGFALTDGAGKWINFVVSNKLGTVQEIVVNGNNEVPGESCL